MTDETEPQFTEKELDKGLAARARRAQGEPAIKRHLKSVSESARQAAHQAERAAKHAERAASSMPPVARKVVVGGAPPARGNQRKFNPQRQAQYLDALAMGRRRSEAAKLAGVTLRQVGDYRKIDPTFADKEALAEVEACETMEDALWNMGVNGDRAAAIEWLRNRAPDRWKNMDKLKVEHSGTVTQELEVGPAMERIQLLQAKLEERRALTTGQTDDFIDVEVIDDGYRPDR